ncbi:MAG: SRPBCC family protein [Actinomycetota bacterium]|nr:SRPBCC family protein [Actinomycetota bacterium]
MTSTTEETAVHHQITVEVSAERAFKVFTEQFDQIKPREHNMLGVPIAQTVFETYAGGAVFDRGEDGSECRWARVLAFEPPERFVISWDISPQWQVEADPDRTSEVEVRFVAEGPTRTRVELEHRHLDRHGAGWESARDGVGGEGGWPLYLQRFAEVASPA